MTYQDVMDAIRASDSERAVTMMADPTAQLTDAQIIALVATLCRTEDARQVADGEVTGDLTGASSAEQAGTVETLGQALSRTPTAADWRAFVSEYDS